MANEFVARKGIISSGSLTIAPLSGNTDEIVSLTAAGTLQSAGFTSASMAASIAAAAGTFDLDFSADSGTNGSVDNSQTFAIVGGNGISTTSNGNQQLTISGVAGLVSGSEQIAINSTDGTLAVNKGGTGQTSYTDGQILVGNSTGNTLAKQTLSGDVTMTNAGVVTIGDDKVTYAKMQNVSATDRILGRDSAGAGIIEEITPSALRTMINVEDGADVTDATNVKANLPAGVVSGSISSPNQGEISVNGVTVDLGLQTSDSPTFSGLSVTNDVTISGDLTVLGAAVELQVSELNIEDKTVTVASGSTNNAAADNAGIVIDRGTDGTAQLKWDSASTSFQLSHKLGIPDQLYHTGDTDTYLGFATNRISLYTNNTLGIYVDGQGDVGIGTSGGGNLLGAKLTVAGNISGSGRLFLGTVDSNTTSTAALVLNGTEVEQRTLATGAFTTVGNSATQDTGSMTVRLADLADSATSATNATNATNFNVAADNSTNATHYVIFTGGATGNQRPNSDTALTYNPSTDTLTVGTVAGHVKTSGNQDIAGTKTFTGVIEIETDNTNSTVALSSDYTATIGATAVDLHIYDVSDNAALFYDYTLQSTEGTSRGRAGSVIASYDRSSNSVTFTEFSSGDVGGGTSDVVLNVVYDSNQVKLQATNTTGDNFKAKVYVRTM